jgi:hypothetical protein
MYMNELDGHIRALRRTVPFDFLFYFLNYLQIVEYTRLLYIIFLPTKIFAAPATRALCLLC